MKANKVAPWEGELIWVSKPNTGTSNNGREWKVVDFVLEWENKHGHMGHICFNAFGVEKADKVLSIPIGTMVRVTFVPDARKSQDGERWFGRLSVIDIEPITKETEQPASDPGLEGNATDDKEDLPW